VGRFREVLHSVTARQRQALAEWRARREQWLASRSAPEGNAPRPAVWSSPGAGSPGGPAAAFLRAEIERQRRATEGREEVARHFGRRMGQVLKQHQSLRTQLEATDRNDLLEQVNVASSRNGFALSEAAWQALDEQATTKDLRAITMLALLPEHEINFWHWRNHVLESPDLWPILATALAGG
jgi:hypothetical protein